MDRSDDDDDKQCHSSVCVCVFARVVPKDTNIIVPSPPPAGATISIINESSDQAAEKFVILFAAITIYQVAEQLKLQQEQSTLIDKAGEGERGILPAVTESESESEQKSRWMDR